MRHAKAEQVAASDVERGLLEPGREDAAEAGSWLAGQGIRPDHALVSAAARTRQTWEALAGAAGWELEAATLVVVGHNPTIAYLAQLLDDGDGDVAASNEMAMGYPTSAVTVMEYDGAWADLGAGTARVLAFHVGRG